MTPEGLSDRGSLWSVKEAGYVTTGGKSKLKTESINMQN